jgi:hypothetical protein
MGPATHSSATTMIKIKAADMAPGSMAAAAITIATIGLLSYWLTSLVLL